jgi:two-component system, cell cycle response regulator DivK
VLSVLIVDDNPKNLKLARDVLRAAGFRTIEAETGAVGIALAVEHMPDVILMDLRLPDMDGADAARALGSDPRTASIPVVALSALRLDHHDEGPFAGSLDKPISVVALPEQVRRFCAPP